MKCTLKLYVPVLFMHIGYFDSGLINIEQKCQKKHWKMFRTKYVKLRKFLEFHTLGWGEAAKECALHIKYYQGKCSRNVRVLPGEYLILRWVQYTGYLITGEDYQCDDVWKTCLKRICKIHCIEGRVVKKYNVKILSEQRSKSDCTFFLQLRSEKWLKFVSTALKWSVREVLNVKSVSLCQTGDIKATAPCEVGWRIMKGVCQLHSRGLVRKVLNVKFVSRKQFALAEKISRGRSTILNFQHFLYVKQLSSQQTNFGIDMIKQQGFLILFQMISAEKLISQPLMWCGFFIFHSCHAFRELR